MTKVLDQAQTMNMKRREMGQHGRRKARTANGVEAKDRMTKGTCMDCITSTTCARNTKSGTSSTPAYPSVSKSKNNNIDSCWLLFYLIHVLGLFKSIEV
jgi:hypothetical protein